MATHSSFLPGKFYGQGSLAGYSPWGWEELDTTKRLSTVHNTRDNKEQKQVSSQKEWQDGRICWITRKVTNDNSWSSDVTHSSWSRGILIYLSTHQIFNANSISDTFLGAEDRKTEKKKKRGRFFFVFFLFCTWLLGEENKIVSKSLVWQTGLLLYSWNRKFKSVAGEKKSVMP